MTTDTPFHIWYQLWQKQLEQSFRLWGQWAQFVPHESASQLAAEAEALKSGADDGHAH